MNQLKSDSKTIESSYFIASFGRSSIHRYRIVCAEPTECGGGDDHGHDDHGHNDHTNSFQSEPLHLTHSSLCFVCCFVSHFVLTFIPARNFFHSPFVCIRRALVQSPNFMVVHITLEMRLKLRYCFFFCCSVICVNTWKHLRVHWPYLLIRQHEHLIFLPPAMVTFLYFGIKRIFFLKKNYLQRNKIAKNKGQVLLNWASKPFFSCVCTPLYVCALQCA